MIQPRILWNAKDFPLLPSGYGIIGLHLLPRLRDRYGAENIIIYAPVYQRDHKVQWEGMLVVGGTEFGYGENLLLDHYRNYGCNLLLHVGDMWPLGILPDLAAQNLVLWVSWCAVDWLGMPKNILNRIKPAHKLVPFSKYGEGALRRAGLTNVEPAIWIGLDTNIWRPTPREELAPMMGMLGFGWESFNILIVAANQERKRVREELEAIAMLRKLRPTANVRLYIHSLLLGERDLRADIDELGLGDIFVYPDQYIMGQGGIREEEMCMMYNCADIVLDCCMEGFGLSQTQAQACGVPVVCLSEGAGPELVVSGVEVPAAAVVTSAHQMAQPVPDPVQIARALVDVCEMRQRQGMPLRSQAAVDFVQHNLSWDTIAQQWFGVIERCMADRERYCMDILEPAEWLGERANAIREVV